MLDLLPVLQNKLHLLSTFEKEFYINSFEKNIIYSRFCKRFALITALQEELDLLPVLQNNFSYRF